MKLCYIVAVKFEKTQIVVFNYFYYISYQCLYCKEAILVNVTKLKNLFYFLLNTELD